MFQTVFCSDEMPPDERLPRFDAFQLAAEHPMRVTSERPRSFRATARALDLSSVNVVELSCSPSDVLRTPALIKKADPELYSLVLAVHGGLGVAQSGREVALGRHEMAVYDSSVPFLVRLGPQGPATTLVRAHVPRALLPRAVRDSRRLTAVRLPGRDGVGALLRQFLVGLTEQAGSYRPSDVPRLNLVALDLLTAVLAHHLEDERGVPPESRERALRLRVEAFVREHLDDPRLSPTTIAAAQHVSVSYLHRLFADRDTTLAAWIRDQRLERARRDLADPDQFDVPVHRIATRWGFTSHAAFTRAFRSAHAMPPRDYRQLACVPEAR